jgi:hypothetical protein
MSEYRRSSWKYETGASQSASIGLLSGTRGMIVLSTPDGTKHRFNAANAGIGFGLRAPEKIQLPDIALPRAIFKGNTITGGGSTTDFDGNGWVWKTPAFHREELTINDFCGATNSFDGAAGLLVGYGVSLLFVGIPQVMMMAGILNAAFIGIATRQAKALIIMRGITEGLIDGLSVFSTFGGLSYAGQYTD